MNWKIVFSKEVQKQIDRLDFDIQARIKKAIDAKLLKRLDIYLEPLAGTLADFYKFRVGDYRLICTKDDGKLIITAVKIGHRREIYTLH